MTPQQQKDFLTDMANAVVSELHNKIDNGRIPEKWDAAELRQILAEKFDAERVLSLSTRLIAFRDVVRTNKL